MDDDGIRWTTSTKDIPFYASVNQTLETCAEPGDCGTAATVEVEVEGVTLGFCETHAAGWVTIGEEA